MSNSTPHDSARLSRLIARLCDGELDAAETAELNTLLNADSAAREAYLDHVSLHALLERELGGKNSVVREFGSPSENVATSAKRPWFQAVAQLAAGLIIGAFLTSAVWAYGLPLISAATQKTLPIANGGFEDFFNPPAQGVPRSPGMWSGDFVTITSTENGIHPRSGNRMLRFLRADDAFTAPGIHVVASELWQSVDLRPLRSMMGKGPVTVQLSAWFNAVPHPGRRCTAGVSLGAYSEEPSAGPQLWRSRHQLSLAESEREELIDDDPETWQRVDTQVAVPPDATLLLVQIRVSDKSAEPHAGASSFSGHYADEVTLRVVDPQPTTH